MNGAQAGGQAPRAMKDNTTVSEVPSLPLLFQNPSLVLASQTGSFLLIWWFYRETLVLEKKGVCGPNCGAHHAWFLSTQPKILILFF